MPAFSFSDYTYRQPVEYCKGCLKVLRSEWYVYCLECHKEAGEIAVIEEFYQDAVFDYHCGLVSKDKDMIKRVKERLSKNIKVQVLGDDVAFWVNGFLFLEYTGKNGPKFHYC